MSFDAARFLAGLYGPTTDAIPALASNSLLLQTATPAGSVSPAPFPDLTRSTVTDSAPYAAAQQPDTLCDHLAGPNWQDDVAPDRPGWVRTTCRACGQLIGYRPTKLT